MQTRNATFFLILTLTGASPLSAQFGGGNGSAADPYQISTPSQLQAVASHLHSHFVLTADIDMAGQAFSIIAPGTTSSNFPLFEGTLDGAGQRVLNLTLPVPAAGQINGLFGKIGPNGIVRDFHLVDVDVDGNSCVAGLAAENRGLIERCSVTGDVSGAIWVGGLVGDNRADVVDCYSRASVSGISSVGGLVGVNFLNAPPRIPRCYVAGAVSAPPGAGGLVGSNLSSTPQIVSSYWDTSVTGQTTSAGGGSGRTTAQLFQQATYVGWDFTSIWCIDEGISYPENVGCFSPAATCTLRNGSGVNPVACSCATLPVLGTTWNLSITPASNTIGTFCFASTALLTAPLLGGESLISLPVVNLPGNLTHSIALPFAPQFSGLMLFVQGLRLNTTGNGLAVELTNAQEALVGF